MKIYCIADSTYNAQAEYQVLKDNYPDIHFQLPKSDEIATLIVLGGDGFMLHTLHEHLISPWKFFGMNCGTVGFLMNNFNYHDLVKRIRHAEVNAVYPLQMKVTDSLGKIHKMLAINEASILRHTHQAAHLQISINDTIKIEMMVADGILLATPAGSGAYNASAGGPIFPFSSKILALTAINPYKPRRWRGALIPDNSRVTIDVLDADKRPVNANADSKQILNVKKVEISQIHEQKVMLLFDSGHSLEERIINEQFVF